MTCSAENSYCFVDSYRKHEIFVFEGCMFHRVSFYLTSTYFKCIHRENGYKASISFKDFSLIDCAYSSYIVRESKHEFHIPNPEKVTKHECIALATEIMDVCV